MKKIVIAPDSFKGSLTSEEVALAVEEGIKAVCPDVEVLRLPMADGGEGILDILVSAWRGHYILLKAHDPLMQIIDTRYGISDDGKKAFIEMAAVSGLPLVPVDQRNPLRTTTYGLGELIRDALDRGCRDFLIGIGGSATQDAGLGMLQALGFRFLDKDGCELGVGGEMMEKVTHVDFSSVMPELSDASFTIACDVDNPFYGPEGAAYVYAPQKGADEEMVERLDKGMRSLAGVILQATGVDVAHAPGAGAAGGLGGGFLAFLRGQLAFGIRLLLDTLNFEQQIKDAGLIITGEGKMDRQTLMGKVPYGILEIARKRHIPVIAIAGKIEDEIVLQKAGFYALYSVTPEGMALEHAMDPEIAKMNIRKAIISVLLSQ